MNLSNLTLKRGFKANTVLYHCFCRGSSCSSYLHGLYVGRIEQNKAKSEQYEGNDNDKKTRAGRDSNLCRCARHRLEVNTLTI